jgi:hypothetical protein
MFPLTSVSRPALGPTQPMATRGPFPGGKARPGRDADHSPSSSAEVVNKQGCTSSPPKRLRGV